MWPDLALIFFFLNGFEVAVSRETPNTLEVGVQGLQPIAAWIGKPLPGLGARGTCAVDTRTHGRVSTARALWELPVQRLRETDSNTRQREAGPCRESADGQGRLDGAFKRSREGFTGESASDFGKDSHDWNSQC